MSGRTTADIIKELLAGAQNTGHPIGREAADRLAELDSENQLFRTALQFYADPDTYFACSFWFDPPTGGFDDDFSDDHGGDYDRDMPGKMAREVLLGEVPS